MVTKNPIQTTNPVYDYKIVSRWVYTSEKGKNCVLGVIFCRCGYIDNYMYFDKNSAYICCKITIVNGWVSASEIFHKFISEKGQN